MKFKKFLFALANCACAIAMFVAVNSVNGMCFWKAYQPEVPKSLLND